MSYSFRQRLKMALAKELREKLSLSQADVQYIKDNIMKICPVSDEVAKALAKHDHRFKGMSLDEIIDKMTDAEFEDFVREVLDIAFKKLAYKKKADKKKKQAEAEAESDTDAETDSDSTSEESVQEEAEVECSTNDK